MQHHQPIRNTYVLQPRENPMRNISDTLVRFFVLPSQEEELPGYALLVYAALAGLGLIVTSTWWILG